MRAKERRKRIRELAKEIVKLERELEALEDEEALSKSPVKPGDTIEIDHATVLSKGKKVIRRYRVHHISSGTWPVWAQQIKQDGTLGEVKHIWQHYSKVEPNK